MPRNTARCQSLSGKVKLDWTSDGRTIEFIWTETGGPTATKPATLGFGTRIVLASIERQLGGRVEFDWKPQGLTCIFAIPQGDKKETAERYAAPRASDKDGAAPDPRISISGNRVMIVEDEALVAMVVTELLTTLGCTVVGPFSRCSDAIAAIEADEIDAAILDVNLDGEMVYPLADMLAHRGVPFIFVTGYGAESIDRPLQAYSGDPKAGGAARSAAHFRAPDGRHVKTRAAARKRQWFRAGFGGIRLRAMWAEPAPLCLDSFCFGFLYLPHSGGVAQLVRAAE